MKPHCNRPELTPQETQLIQQIRQQPQMLARLQSILDLAHAADGPLKTADEIEALLIQELRQLGSTTMHQWATQAEDPTLRRRLKNADVVACVYGSGSSQSKSYVRPLPQRLGVTPRGRSRRLERVLTDSEGRAFLCTGGGQCPGALRFRDRPERGALTPR